MARTQILVHSWWPKTFLGRLLRSNHYGFPQAARQLFGNFSYFEQLLTFWEISSFLLILRYRNSFRGRSQDFSRGTHKFPNPIPPKPYRVQNLFLVPWLKVKLRCRPKCFLLYCEMTVFQRRFKMADAERNSTILFAHAKIFTRLILILTRGLYLHKNT